MPTIRLPTPRRVLLRHESQLNRHILWTQEFSRSEGSWSAPKGYNASKAISSNPRCWGTPFASMLRWALSRPLVRYFIFVTHLTISNYGDIRMQDVLKMLNSMPRLEELELCRVDILGSTTGPFVRPTHMPRSLKRLAIEACNITHGLSDAHYDLLFRFLALFERIERLRLVASLFRLEDLFYEPNFHHLRLPTIVHLEAEGFFAHVLLEFCCQGYPVRELVSLQLSRCFAVWANLYWIAGIVRAVAPTLQHFAFRPNLTASLDGVHDWPALCRDFTAAVAQCTKLRELELGLYAHGQPGFAGVYDFVTTLFSHTLAALALPAPRLDHVAFVLDVGEGLWPEDVPWMELDALLSRVCVKHGSPVQVRLYRYEPEGESRGLQSNARGRPLAPQIEYSDPTFWRTRLPMMWHWMTVRGWVAAKRLAVGQYAAPMGIDEQRVARIAMPGLRSPFEQ